MSTWVCNDFDEEFNQTFTISRITSFNALRIKVLKIGTVNSSATFTFKILDGTDELFSQTITSDFINANLPDNGDRADLVFEIDSFVLNRNINNTGKDYILNFTSSGYTTTTTSRFMVCKRQEDDKAVPIAGATATNINNKALEAPIFFEIFRWSKDSKE